LEQSYSDAVNSLKSLLNCTGLLMFPKVESFIFGGVNLLNFLFLLLSLPFAHVDLTKRQQMELLLNLLGLQLD